MNQRLGYNSCLKTDAIVVVIDTHACYTSQKQPFVIAPVLLLFYRLQWFFSETGLKSIFTLSPGPLSHTESSSSSSPKWRFFYVEQAERERASFSMPRVVDVSESPSGAKKSDPDNDRPMLLLRQPWKWGVSKQNGDAEMTLILFKEHIRLEGALVTYRLPT